MEAFRIHNAAFAALDGTGAALHGARWNPRGRAVVYAAASYEGALLEQLVHAGIGRLPRNRIVSRIHIPDTAGVDVARDLGAAFWQDERATRGVGSAWLRARTTVALVVPSAVARPYGRNVLLNPEHPAFAQVEVVE
ncbi:MAG: RES domain-containing protein, partial [Gemmatimonadota bacterium]